MTLLARDGLRGDPPAVLLDVAHHVVNELQAATRDEPRLTDGRKPLRRPPIHRYSFAGKGGDGIGIRDLTGRLARYEKPAEIGN